MQHSHLFTGNTHRLQSVFDKAAQGKPISLVFLGASVTLGYLIERRHQFTTAVQEYFRETFHNPEISCHNLSVAGLPSLHGLYLSYFELEQYSPDFICIDYSVNDQKNPAFREAFESLLIKCLTLPTSPAVISFFVKKEEGYTCTPQMSAVCEYYDIPYVNVGSWLDEDISRGTIRWRDFSYDDCHPGPVGHGYIGKCLLRLLDAARHTPQNQAFRIPEQGFYKNELAFLHFYPSEWKNTPSCHPAPLTLDAECRTLFVGYFVDTTEDFGKASLSVDGTNFHCLDSYRVHEWDHPEFDVLYLSNDKMPHHISLQMTEGETDKRFHLLCLGYV